MFLLDRLLNWPCRNNRNGTFSQDFWSPSSGVRAAGWFQVEGGATGCRPLHPHDLPRAGGGPRYPAAG